MKKVLLLFLLLGIRPVAFTQSQIQTTITDREAGTDFRTNTPLKAREYAFGMPVYRIHPLLDQNSFTVQLRKKNPNKDVWTMAGQVLVFDPSTGQTKWQRKFKYAQSNLLLEGNIMLEQRGGRLERLNPENGTPIWKAKNIAFKIYPEFNRALCYDLPATGQETIHGIDLENGQSLWQRRVPGRYGWESIDMLNDETILVKASGLHTIRLTNGFGWDVDRVSHAEKTDMAKVGLAVLTGAAVGAMGGFAVPYGNFSNIFLNISSNILYNRDTLYFAAKDKISCHTLEGKNLWSTDLNEKETSKSHLFREGNTIFMINTGYAMKYGRPAKFGRPFVAAFDASTGKQLFLKVWEDRKNYFTDYMIQGRDLYLVYQDKVEIHEFSNEGLTQKFGMRMDQESKLREFVSDQMFSKKDSVYSQLSFDKDHYYIFSEEGELLQFDNEFVLLGKLDKETLYQNYLETDGFKFLGNKKETFIVDRQSNREVGQCPATIHASKIGSKLYHRTENQNVLEIDISPFLTNLTN